MDGLRLRAIALQPGRGRLLQFEADVENGSAGSLTFQLAPLARLSQWVQIVAICIDVKNRQELGLSKLPLQTNLER